MGIRDTMREAFVHATQHGEYVISWRLRVGSIEQLADDTERVLGYRPKGINSFLGLPIEVCPFDAPNELVTSEGTVRLIATPLVRKSVELRCLARMVTPRTPTLRIRNRTAVVNRTEPKQ